MEQRWKQIATQRPSMSHTVGALQSHMHNSSTPQSSIVAAPHPAALIRRPCSWDGGLCGIELDNLSPSGVTRHLKAYHFDPATNPWNSRRRGRCRRDRNCRSDDMNYENFGKHVAEIHLKTTKYRRPRCGTFFARGDTLSRHRREKCDD